MTTSAIDRVGANRQRGNCGHWHGMGVRDGADDAAGAVSEQSEGGENVVVGTAGE